MNNRCIACGAEMITTREDHPYVEAGLPHVVIADMPIARCSSCGEEEIGFERIESLHKAIAHALTQKPARWGGAEVRFLRKYLGLSGVDFSKQIGVSAEQVSRWERGHDTIGPQSDRLLRLMVAMVPPVESYPLAELANIADDARPVRLIARRSGASWRAEMPAL